MKKPSHLVKKNLKLQLLLTIISCFVSSFFLTSTIHLFKYDVLRNFFNIKLVNLQELLFFFAAFSLIFIIFFILYQYYLERYIQSITSLTWIIFLFVFSLFSPVKSLVIGALIIAIPSLFITFFHAINAYRESEDKNNRIIHTVIFSLSALIFALMVVVLIQKSKLIFELPATQNLSNISDALIYAPHMIERWHEVSYVFLGLIFLGILYGLYHHFKPLKNIKIPFVFIGYLMIGLLLIIQVVILAVMMSYRVKVLLASTYDFGLFVQMFHNMKSFNGMITTLERSVALSHLHVHFSPIYYLMLPVFMIFPYAETLQVLQIVVVAIGMIPLWLITKEFKTSSFIRFAVLMIYILSPSIITSHFYDIHENCFLAPLLLFVLYFAIKKNSVWLIITMILTLLIKEDAAIYLVFIGLYLIFNALFLKSGKKETKTMIHGGIMVISSIIYFFIITHFLNESGDGAMFWRYNNLFINDHSSISEIIAGFLLNPSYYLATFFAPMKINTLLILFGAVGFLPFFMKNFSGYLLMVPVIIINYLSTYPYQHQFGFQYFYGSTVLIIFMALLAEKDHHPQDIQKNKSLNFMPFIHLLSLVGLAVSAVHGFRYIDEINGYYKQYQAQESYYQDMKNTLLSIPKDKHVVASGYLTAYLSDRYYLYDYDYFNYSTREVEIDYFIIDGRISSDKLELITDAIGHYGFVESELSTNSILIFEPNN